MLIVDSELTWAETTVHVCGRSSVRGAVGGRGSFCRDRLRQNPHDPAGEDEGGDDGRLTREDEVRLTNGPNRKLKNQKWQKNIFISHVMLLK